MTEHDARVEDTAQRLRLSARDARLVIFGDDAVSEEVAAHLLGYAPGSLANLRRSGGGPAWHKVRRVRYRVRDLAIWLERGRVEQGEVKESHRTPQNPI